MKLFVLSRVFSFDEAVELGVDLGEALALEFVLTGDDADFAAHAVDLAVDLALHTLDFVVQFLDVFVGAGLVRLKVAMLRGPTSSRISSMASQVLGPEDWASSIIMSNQWSVVSNQ